MRKPIKNISHETLKEWLAASKDKLVLLDVRTQQEYDAGHLPDALLMDIKELDFAEDIMELPKDKTYVVYCRIGIRSANACSYMQALGFEHCYNLVGGLEGGWPVIEKL